ncbi:MAG TPA: lipid-A-disaccharide synthase [Patescibacteria group bacterium]|nr:lipid-A-disaccharide synthase [Patescibacteria group bacterium]
MSAAPRTPRVLIVAGEASGDLYGGLLMRAMAAEGAVTFTGIGGPTMRAAGLAAVADASSLAVTGILEVAARFPLIWAAWRAITQVLDDPAQRPDLAILIDYPDFNLRVAARAKRAGVPVLYFISPQVWAWRRGRLARMSGIIDRMLVILPFEEALYRAASIPVEFIGHPLLDLVRPERTRGQARALLGLDPDRPMVALLPGSRPNEVRAHLGPLLGAARILGEEFRDLQFALTVAPTLPRAFVQSIMEGCAGPRRPPVLVGEDRYDAVASADVAVVASGTATLETALLGVPLVVVYRMNLLTYFLARLATDLPHIGMPNLIAGRRIAPELVQGDCTPERIAAETRRLLTDPDAARTMRRELEEVRGRLGQPGAIGRAARAAWDMIRSAPGGRAG